MLAEYLFSKRYFVGDDDGCKHFKPSDMKEHDYRSSVIAAPARWLLSEGRGFLYRAVNLRWQCIDNNASYRDFPIALRQRFSTIPNYIEIDTFREHYSAQVEEGTGLEKWLSGKGHRTYIRSFNGELVDIIEAAHPGPEEKADELHKLVQEFLEKNSIQTFDLSGMPEEFLLLLHRLHPDTITVLKTAELIRKALPDLPDCSAIVIEYCKAIEIELNYRLLEPLRRPVYATGNSSVIPQTTPAALSRLKQYVCNASPKQIELGTMAVTIGAALKYDSHPLAAGLLRNLRELPFSGSPTKLIDGIKNLTQNHRNPAAHKTIISSMQMEQCRELVLGVGPDIGLLYRIVQSS